MSIPRFDSVSPTTKPQDATNPDHYKRNGMEAIDVIEAFGLDFYLGNVTKYVLRAGRKGEALEDLRKAYWYLGRKISQMTGEPHKERK